jgi:hypothetical protein
LKSCLDSPDLEAEDPNTLTRVRETLDFIEILTAWADEMLLLKPETLMKTLGLGAKISQTLRRNSAE